MKRTRTNRETVWGTGAILAPVLPLMLLFSLLFFSTHAYALSTLEANQIDRNRRGSITVSVNTDEWYVEGALFHLYQVAEIDDSMEFHFTDGFRSSGVDESAIQPSGWLSSETSGSGSGRTVSNTSWMNAAQKLTSYAGSHSGSVPEYTSPAAISGRSVTFRNLPIGLYLVQGDTATEGTRTVSYQPVLICIPQRSSASDPWNYDIRSYVKSADPSYAPSQSETPKTSETNPRSEQPETLVTETKGRTDTPRLQTETGSSTVKTGDTSVPELYLALLTAAAAAVMLLTLSHAVRSAKKRR